MTICSRSDRGSERSTTRIVPSPATSLSKPEARKSATFSYSDRAYSCELIPKAHARDLRIQNSEGHELVLEQGQRQGQLIKPGRKSQVVNVSEPFFYYLVKAALSALVEAPTSD